MDPDRLAQKFADLIAGVSKELRKGQIRECLDQMVLDCEIGYDLETDEYWLLPDDESEAEEQS